MLSNLAKGMRTIFIQMDFKKKKMGKKPSLGIQTNKYGVFPINNLKYTSTKKVGGFTSL